MISQMNSSAVTSAYQTQTKNNQVRATQQNGVSLKQESKIEQIKESIDSGAFKVDINALSEKIADSLL